MFSLVCHHYPQVWVHEGLSQRDSDFDLCGMVSTTPNIPDEGYFGISAATGGLSDDHDVMSFIVHSLHPLDEGEEVNLLHYNEEENVLKSICYLALHTNCSVCCFIRMLCYVKGNTR